MTAITVLYDPRTETVIRVDPDADAPDNRDASAIRVDESGLLACGWEFQEYTRRYWWLAFPPGDAADIAEAVLDCAKPGFFTADEIRAVEAAIREARS